MAGRQQSFSWNADTLVRNLNRLPEMLERLVVAAVEYHATRGENYMRKSAKWTDRSTNARNGLHTTTFHSDREHGIVFAHGVPYGIWLEIRWAGKYAIIMPSVLKTGADVMKTLDKGMARLR